MQLVRWTRERGNGMAGAEWHFQVQPPGEIGRTLVPDVAFLSYKRLPRSEMEETEVPRIAPDMVVEVQSLSDQRCDIEEKVRVYLASGTDVVFLVNPLTRTVTIRDRKGTRDLSESETLER
ncbi:MAG: Uma2 family endonuclease [Candidatus Eremiobacteraeota bacterium]|nr:Uma2 family endonuclease [Candidatus Eremiobacteraeota bacterium]MBV8365619.1 Uma2 family endonuclease [Candidatus Eremiobacteraeota bacterium]